MSFLGSSHTSKPKVFEIRQTLTRPDDVQCMSLYISYLQSSMKLTLISCFRQRLKYIYICMFCLPVVSFSLWLFWKTCPTIKPIFLRNCSSLAEESICFSFMGWWHFFTWDERFTLHGLSFINFKICTAAYYPILKIWIWMNLSAPSFGWLVGWLIDWLIVCVCTFSKK